MALAAFVVAAATLMAMLVGGALVLAVVSDRTVGRLRGQGAMMKRWGGSVLLLLAAWFAYMAVATPTWVMR